MKQYTAKQIKNIAFLGHGGSGKTTLVDSILYYGKAVERIGKIADGTTVMDFDGEEKKRKTSVQLSCYPLEINDNKWNILDAPGLFDFEAGAAEALSAADRSARERFCSQIYILWSLLLDRTPRLRVQ